MVPQVTSSPVKATPKPALAPPVIPVQEAAAQVYAPSASAVPKGILKRPGEPVSDAPNKRKLLFDLISEDREMSDGFRRAEKQLFEEIEGKLDDIRKRGLLVNKADTHRYQEMVKEITEIFGLKAREVEDMVPGNELQALQVQKEQLSKRNQKLDARVKDRQ